MSIKKFTAVIIMAITLISPVSLTSCVEKTQTERTTIEKAAPVIVPERGKIDVNVHTDSQPAPNVIHKDTTTNTTIEKDINSGVKTETKTESTTVH